MWLGECMRVSDTKKRWTPQPDFIGTIREKRGQNYWNTVNKMLIIHWKQWSNLSISTEYHWMIQKREKKNEKMPQQQQ